MFSFLKKKQAIAKPGAILHTDMHAHWLPGIDDGVKTMEESMDMLEAFAELGYRRLIATPHAYWDYYKNTTEIIEKAFKTVKSESDMRFPELELRFAAEYYMDDNFRDLLKKKQLLCLWDNKVLVEQGYFAELPGLHEILFDMQVKGYQPVLAHPERYLYYAHDEKKLRKLKDAGTEMQLNIGSLTGKYGQPVQKQAYKMIESGYIDYFSSDAHSAEDVQALSRLQLKDPAILKTNF